MKMKGTRSMKKNALGVLFALIFTAYAAAPAFADICSPYEEHQQALDDFDVGKYASMEVYLEKRLNCYLKKAAESASFLGRIATIQLHFVLAADYHKQAFELDPENLEYRAMFEEMEAKGFYPE